ncbi:hypothetical protein RhiirC2_775868 [Rhizophagus irregularis]|uniref:Uncharacterized protein n=1 Tax=Rhizophagus irregularis TaxID=588596 RepID=A0A2N1NI80_9GLOM|nr:hypothetical protein RhiirC2_775868 [Rhizophagus irregularis]
MLGINDPDIMSLWKVDIAKSEEYQLKDVNNYIVDIEDKLDDVKLSPDRMLENYFSVIPITTIIHIIVHVPTAAAKSRFEPPKTLEEIIKSITKGLRKRDPKLSDKLDMPLQQRDFKSVVERIRESEIDSWDKLDISNNSSIIRPTIIRMSPGISHLVDTESCGYTII